MYLKGQSQLSPLQCSSHTHLFVKFKCKLQKTSSHGERERELMSLLILWIQQGYSATEGVTFKVPTSGLTRNKFILLGQDCTPDDRFLPLC